MHNAETSGLRWHYNGNIARSVAPALFSHACLLVCCWSVVTLFQGGAQHAPAYYVLLLNSAPIATATQPQP